MHREFVFDQPHARALVEARVSLLRPMLRQCKAELDLRTALDVGCGVGYFAALLRDLDLDVTGVEGRSETAGEARRRVPGLKVQVGDAEELSSFGFASFDFVLALGLLYHLENPFRVIRQLRNLTRKLLVVESMCVRDSRPILCLRDEEHGEDQSLRYVAFYPSEICLVKMLYCAGFPFVYRFRKLPDHPDFSARLGKHRVRSMLAASMQPLAELYFTQAKVPAALSDPWTSMFGRSCDQLMRLGRFVVKPWSEKIATLRRKFGVLDAREY